MSSKEYWPRLATMLPMKPIAINSRTGFSNPLPRWKVFAIYDTMQYIKPDVSTTVMGQAASAAAVLLLAGTKGKRYALPHSRVLLHQPHGGAEGQAVDIEIQAKEMTRYRKLMEQLIAEHTGQSLEKVAKDTDRDFILTAQEAVEYGVVDEVITSRKITPGLTVAAGG